jgi:hypothetical protein
MAQNYEFMSDNFQVMRCTLGETVHQQNTKLHSYEFFTNADPFTEMEALWRMQRYRFFLTEFQCAIYVTMDYVKMCQVPVLASVYLYFHKMARDWLFESHITVS